MAKVKPRVKVPKSATVGEIVTIKTLISHKMETGLRKDKKTGELIPQDIIHSFDAKFNGETVFSTTLHAGISANPYVAFPLKVTGAGELEFTWHADGDKTYSKKSKLKVA